MSKHPLAENLLWQSYCFLPANPMIRDGRMDLAFAQFRDFLELSEKERARHTLTIERGPNLSGKPLEPDDGYMPPKPGNDVKHGLQIRRDVLKQFTLHDRNTDLTFYQVAWTVRGILDKLHDDFERVYDQLDHHPSLKGHKLDLLAAYTADRTLSVVRMLQYFGLTLQTGEHSGVVGKRHQDKSFGTRLLCQSSGDTLHNTGDLNNPADWKPLQAPPGMDVFFLGVKAALATGGKLHQPKGLPAYTTGGALKALWHLGWTDPATDDPDREVMVAFTHNNHIVYS